ncbi:acyl-CoA dehydrogenase family member 9, mitochondrial [Anoplophora glabripennis]|uniref:acyl-CoA dehydrogenase family member 9, mitochondrial n=1 Tax=Anoplophora glabripennis TaxID=217634 RepID=UPI0008735F1F|nr:acyl-CoA dehydrogenase family member 9, mitochondrial [Anoplophora glabripennis]
MLSARILNCCKLFKYKKWSTTLLNAEYVLSTQPAIQSTHEKYEKQLKDFETLTTVIKKKRQKKPQRPPFAKNLFLGVFDTDVLSYPELEKEDIDCIEPAAAAVEKLMKQEHMVNCNTLSDKNFRQNLSDYKTIGLQAPQLMDGRECSVTESNKFLEVLSCHNLRDNIIFNEQLGVQILVKFANDQLKKKYLHGIMKGDSISCFCMSEADLPEITSMRTKAVISDDKKTWILNGEKAWVVNGTSANLLIVCAMTELVVRDLIKEPKLTLFIVDRNSPGVSYTKVDTNDVEMANISFDNTQVPNENVIGKVNKADVILSSIMNEFRLSSGAACIAITKQILNRLALSMLEQSNDSNMLYKTDAVRGKIAELTTKLYAMESVLYLTTGLIDSYENQDCELESAIVKIFCSQSCLTASLTALDMVGMPAISESHWASKFHKDITRHLSLHETNDSLEIMTALFGLQFAGVQLNERISKIRNPLFHGSFILRRMWTDRRNVGDDPKLDLRLGDYLHPSLDIASKHLEYCVKRLEFATEVLLARFGPDVVNQHIDLRRIAECIINIYVMTACLGRASRSYCIGLQYSNYEMLIASAFCSGAMERVKANVKKIVEGEHVTNDENYRAISKRLFQSKEYFLKHPLSRNF